MARERRRLLITAERLRAATPGDGDLPQLTLNAEESHYVSRVLRLREGQELAIVNGQGQLWGAQVRGGDARARQLQLLQALTAPEQAEAATPHPITLAIALPRRDSELLVRMACELGVDRLQPLIADHKVAERFARQRLEAILREATEQCERLWLPDLAEPCPSHQWLQGPIEGLKLWATTRRGPLPSPLGLLPAQPELSPPETPEPIQLAIGPEGGWSAAEEAAAADNGWQAVGLAGSILRTSTAAVAGVALICHWRDQLRAAPSGN